ncbi:MAG: hypothetical protein Q9179_001439 [Wetmoreana sp. 5 TL-2023]
MLDTRKYNALDLAQPTNFRAMPQSGELLWGTACRIPHEEAARIVATLPHHFCFIDAVGLSAEPHTALSAECTRTGTRAIECNTARQLNQDHSVHIQWLDVNYALNAGAGGVVRPHVQNAQQAARFVRLAKFPPIGDRSYPPMALFGKQTITETGKTVYDVWNEHAAVFCQIEDVEGVENVDEIAQTPGVDALMVGASDLRFSLGLPAGSMDGDEPEFLAALAKIQRAADNNGLAVLGFAVTPGILRKRLKLGWRALICHADASGIFHSGTQSLENNLRVVETVVRAKTADLL